MSRDIFGSHNWGRVVVVVASELLASSGVGQGSCSTSYNAQDSLHFPPPKELCSPKYQLLRNPALCKYGIEGCIVYAIWSLMEWKEAKI